MAILYSSSHGIADCTKLVISMWFNMPPIANPEGQNFYNYSLFEFGGYPAFKTQSYYPTGWVKLGHYGVPSDVPPNSIYDSSHMQIVVGANGAPTDPCRYKRSDTGQFYVSPLYQQFGTVQQSPGSTVYVGTCNFSPWEPPPIIGVVDDSIDSFYIPEPQIHWSIPWAWNGNYYRLWGSRTGEYFCNYVQTPAGWFAPLYNQDSADLWEVTWTAFSQKTWYRNDTSRILLRRNFTKRENSNLVVTLCGAISGPYPVETTSGGESPQKYTACPSLGLATDKSLPDGITQDKWHHLLICCELTEGSMAYDHTDLEFPNCKFYLLVDGVKAGGETQQARLNMFEESWRILDTTPAWQAPYSSINKPDGTGIIVKGKSISLPYDKDADANASSKEDKSNNADHPTPLKRRYAKVQAWFGKYVDPTKPENLAWFLKITRKKDEEGNPTNKLIGNFPSLGEEERERMESTLGKPDLDFDGPPDSFIKNEGKGGNFTKIGTIEDYDPPSDIPIPDNAIKPPDV